MAEGRSRKPGDPQRTWQRHPNPVLIDPLHLAPESTDGVAERVKWTNVYRIVRRSNVYQFRDPLPCAEALNSLRNSSKSENPTEPEIQELHSSTPLPKIIILTPQNQLDATLIRYRKNLKAI